MKAIGSRISASWDYMKMSWEFLMKNKDLALLPVINLIAILLLLAVIGIAGVVLGVFEQAHFNSWGTMILLFAIFYFFLNFATIYLNVVMIACVMERLRSRSGKIRDGIRIANTRLVQIAGWAVMSMTVGLIIRFLESLHSIVADIIAVIFGGAFAIGTYMGLPLMIYEGCGPIESFKRGMKMFGKNWRQMASANAIIILTFAAIYALIHFLAIAMPYLSTDFYIINVTMIVLLFIFMMTFGSAMNAIIRCAVFLSIHAKLNVPGFERERLKRGFRQRRSWLLGRQ